MPVEMSQEDFEAAVGDALDAVPAEFLDLLDNVVFLVEDEPDTELGDILGVYEGVPQTERGWDFGPPMLPDRITIFRGPTLRFCTLRRRWSTRWRSRSFTRSPTISGSTTRG